MYRMSDGHIGREGEARTLRVIVGALKCKTEREVREVRRREKREGSGRCERTRAWISGGREKKRAPRRLCSCQLRCPRAGW